MATTILKELKVETLVSQILSEESLCQSSMGQSASKTSQVKVHNGNGPCMHCGKKHSLDQCWTKYPHLCPKKGGDKGKGKGKGGNGNSKKANGSRSHYHRWYKGHTVQFVLVKWSRCFGG